MILLAGITYVRAATPLQSPKAAAENGYPPLTSPTPRLPASEIASGKAVVAVEHFSKWERPFPFYKKINPVWWLANADDPAPPDDYKPGNPMRKMAWYFRNPFHNLTFYVIGIADKPFWRIGPYPTQTTNPEGGWNWAICERKMLRLGFVDYQRNGFQFYAGWRTGGNFGLKMNFGQAPKSKKRAPERNQ